MVEIPDWIAAQLPSGFRSATHATGAEHMHVLEWGPSDGPAILLQHGNPTWGFVRRKVVAAIRARPGGDQLRLIAPDLILGRVINHLERARPDAKIVRDGGAGIHSRARD